MESQRVTNISILDIAVARMGLDEAIAFCQKELNTNLANPRYYCFVNVHTVTESSYHPQLKTALVSPAAINLADGVPLLWVSKLWREPIASRVSGPDFMPRLIRQNLHTTQVFLGGPPGQAEVLAKKLGVQAVCYSPPFRPFSEAGVQEDLTALRKHSPNGVIPRMVWVGLGAPKQELWVAEASRQVPGSIFFAVGAAFDFLSGTKRRAPLWVQRLGFEWLFRFLQEPRRLFRRYLITNSIFIYRVTIESFKRLIRVYASPSK